MPLSSNKLVFSFQGAHIFIIFHKYDGKAECCLTVTTVKWMWCTRAMTAVVLLVYITKLCQKKKKILIEMARGSQSHTLDL